MADAEFERRDEAPRRPGIRFEGNPLLVPILAFVVGLLVGWWVLGWWLAPVGWTDATPDDLHPTWQQAYVGLVVNAYTGDQDVAAARSRLSDLEPDALQAALSAVATQAVDPDLQRGAADLAARLAVEIDPSTVFEHAIGTDSGEVQSADPGGDSSAASSGDTGWNALALSKLLAMAALVAALVGAGVLAWVWYGWRKETDDPAVQSALPEAFAPRPDTAAGSPDSPPWRPERIDLGQTITARYNASEGGRFYQTWLVYDAQGGLLGGAGLQSQTIANINVLELWFFERTEQGEGGGAPVLTIVSKAAYDDKLFRARLGDRELIAAVPGQHVALSTESLELAATVDDAVPDSQSADMPLTAVWLSLTPTRSPAATDEGARPDHRANT